MERSIRLRLNDIIRAIDGTEGTIGGIGFETFQTAFRMPHTVERCIEIVSEATRCMITASLRAHDGGS